MARNTRYQRATDFHHAKAHMRFVKHLPKTKKIDRGARPGESVDGDRRRADVAADAVGALREVDRRKQFARHVLRPVGLTCIADVLLMEPMEPCRRYPVEAELDPSTGQWSARSEGLGILAQAGTLEELRKKLGAIVPTVMRARRKAPNSPYLDSFGKVVVKRLRSEMGRRGRRRGERHFR